MELKWYNLKTSNVVILGDFPYFDKTDIVHICNFGFGTYRGVEVKKRCQHNVYNGDVYKTKKEALEKALKNYEDNAEFIDGITPFEIVFYLRGIGWQIFSSNTIGNEMLVKKKHGLPVPLTWQ